MSYCRSCGTDPCAFQHAPVEKNRKPVLTGVGSFDTSLTYYLAGPMSGYEEYNYPAFDSACHELRESGITILSPHEVPWPENHEKIDQEKLWQYMMQKTDELVVQSGGIILLKGWPGSRGAGIELNLFLERKQPVYYYDNYSLVDMNRRVS